MSSVKRIFAIERLSDIQLNTIKKPINCFLFELEGESRYVTKRTYPSSSETTKLQFHWSIIITSSYHYIVFIYRKGQIERTSDKAATVWRE